MKAVVSTVQEVAEQIFTSDEVKKIAAFLIQLALKPEIKAGALYTYREVAALTGVNYMTIFRAAKAGYLKEDYIGSEPRIRGDAIFQWLDEGGRTGRSKQNLIEEAA